MAKEPREFNPAARLHYILQKASQGRAAAVRQVWAAAFGIKEDDYAGIFWRLTDLYRVVLEIQARVEALPADEVNHDLYLRPFPNVKKVLTYGNLDGAWDTIKSYLDGFTLGGLEFCADLLSRLSPEREIPANDLAELKREVGELLSDLIESTLPPELKEFIAAELRRVQLAIDTYEIRGASGLRDALAHSLGAVVLGPVALRGPESAKEQKRFVKILETIDKITAIATRIPQLVGGATTLLKSLGA
jgi:hypothetical protein